MDAISETVRFATMVNTWCDDGEHLVSGEICSHGPERSTTKLLVLL